MWISRIAYVRKKQKQNIPLTNKNQSQPLYSTSVQHEIFLTYLIIHIKFSIKCDIFILAFDSFFFKFILLKLYVYFLLSFSLEPINSYARFDYVLFFFVEKTIHGDITNVIIQ